MIDNFLFQYERPTASEELVKLYYPKYQARACPDQHLMIFNILLGMEFFKSKISGLLFKRFVR